MPCRTLPTASARRLTTKVGAVPFCAPPSLPSPVRAANGWGRDVRCVVPRCVLPRAERNADTCHARRTVVQASIPVVRPRRSRVTAVRRMSRGHGRAAHRAATSRSPPTSTRRTPAATSSRQFDRVLLVRRGCHGCARGVRPIAQTCLPRRHESIPTQLDARGGGFEPSEL